MLPCCPDEFSFSDRRELLVGLVDDKEYGVVVGGRPQFRLSLSVWRGRSRQQGRPWAEERA